MSDIATDRTFTAKALLVVNTCVVHRQSDKTFYYEIHLAPDAEPGAQKTVLVTRDEPAYQHRPGARRRKGRPTPSTPRGTSEHGSGSSSLAVD
jgi:hypothetical protein